MGRCIGKAVVAGGHDGARLSPQANPKSPTPVFPDVLLTLLIYRVPIERGRKLLFVVRA